MWDLVCRLGGQIRISPAGNPTGYDLCAALRLAEALGIDPAAVGILLPPIEAVMMKKLAEKGGDDG